MFKLENSSQIFINKDLIEIRKLIFVIMSDFVNVQRFVMKKFEKIKRITFLIVFFQISYAQCLAVNAGFLKEQFKIYIIAVVSILYLDWQSLQLLKSSYIFSANC